jgi:hypothetical protein
MAENPGHREQRQKCQPGFARQKPAGRYQEFQVDQYGDHQGKSIDKKTAGCDDERSNKQGE